MMRDLEYFDKLNIPSSLYRKIEREVIQLYIRNEICSVPIDPYKIAQNEKCELVPLSKIRNDLKSSLKRDEFDGLSFFYLPMRRYVIFFDDSQCIQRQKFTIMHELGHILLGHREESNLAKECANYFAAYALAPTPLIWHFNCGTQKDVQRVFDVTEKPAKLRFSSYQKWMNITELNEMEVKLLDLFKDEKTPNYGVTDHLLFI